MIYLISFIEALSGGLTGINLALYLKFVLKLSEIDAAKLISTFGIVSSVLVFLCGSLIDRFGVKKCAIVGASLLTLGRLLLGSTSSLPIVILCLTLGALGSAIKSGSVIVFLKKHNLSFKLDYVVFNVAYCIAGILFDQIGNYSLIYTLSGVFTFINLAVLFFLPKDKEVVKRESKQILSLSSVKSVLIYNFIMTPVACIFTFMGNFIPKATIHIMGPGAPVGKLYGSLNPFIILFTVPLFASLAKCWNINPYYSAVAGTLLSSIALLVVGLPGSYFHLAIYAIILFTIGEAIWSPANMELAARKCPEGEEGKYMTLSLIPRTLAGVFMSYLISFNLTHFIYTDPVNFRTPFILMGIFALITPIALIVSKK